MSGKEEPKIKVTTTNLRYDDKDPARIELKLSSKTHMIVNAEGKVIAEKG